MVLDRKLVFLGDKDESVSELENCGRPSRFADVSLSPFETFIITAFNGLGRVNENNGVEGDSEETWLLIV
jgi:hypothetical protein